MADLVNSFYKTAKEDTCLDDDCLRFEVQRSVKYASRHEFKHDPDCNDCVSFKAASRRMSQRERRNSNITFKASD